MSARILRSAAWTHGDDEVAMSHRVALRIDDGDRDKPVIGIADTTSDLNPCNAVFGVLAGVVADAIRDAGGVPVRFPMMSLGEDLMKPSAMLYRNLAAMELEEQIRANPVDGVVLLANCDKTVPAALMAAASADVPALLLLGGARSAPPFRGRPLGTGTDLWRALDERRAGRLDDGGWRDLERTLRCAGAGSCNTMGTASTMSLVTEALGMALPGATGLAADPAALDAIARETARAVVERTLRGERPSSVLTQDAVDNAAVVLAAIGGSTNAVIHLAAVAGRRGLDASLERFDRLWRDVPLVADVEPGGSALIQDFHDAGGYPTLVRSLLAAGLLHEGARCGDGRTLAEVARDADEPGGVIRSVANPVAAAPTMAAVFGTLAPSGAVIKVAAATPELLQHEGRAVVFSDYADMRERLDDPATEIAAGDVMVIRGIGPAGVPGMPEWGMAPIPKRLLDAGVTDVVRVTDGRMSGTSFGTVVLHVAPEAAVGGPLALVEDGDRIRLDVAGRRLDLCVDDAEIDARRAAFRPPASPHVRGWPRLYTDHVLQADRGADLDFLVLPPGGDPTFIEPVVGRS